MAKLAIIVDGGFIRAKLTKDGVRPDANNIYQKIIAIKDEHFGEDELFRIFYYDSLAIDEGIKKKHPISGEMIPLLADIDPAYTDKLYLKLKAKENVAFRYGELGFSGWRIRKLNQFAKKIKEGEEIVAEDICINVKQKGVDLKIGLDIAWIAMKQIVDKLLIISADSDLVPAMKLARKEGLNVYLATLGQGPKANLTEHSDLVFKGR